jgi:N-acetylmuramic acid 6-phosphate etherase
MARELILGLEGGGTKTTVLLATRPASGVAAALRAAGSSGAKNDRRFIEAPLHQKRDSGQDPVSVQRYTFGPLNLKLVTDHQLRAVFRQFRPTRAAVCLAGCRTAADRQRVRAITNRVWPGIPVFIGNDLDSGHAAAFDPHGAGILVLSGTGSVIFGRNGDRTARAGGWGHLLGDHGSGYWLALTGLRAAIREYDRRGHINNRLRRLLHRLCLNTPDQLVEWIQRASKDEVAGLVPEVLDDDPGLMLQGASFLAQDCHAVAGKLDLKQPRIVLAGGVLLNRRKFSLLVANRIRSMLPGTKVTKLRRDTAEGALLLAGSSFPLPSSLIPHPSSLPSTEQRNPRTMNLDRQTVPQLVATMLAEEARVIPVLRANQRSIVRAINAIVPALKRGGRLFYVGAGTSGRLGVLDASECPPTFSTDPEMVQGIIAGGAPALTRSVEAAEDDPGAGAEALRNRGVGRRDVVVGIAASGRTPFVLGALDEAKQAGAKTFLLCFSPPSSLHTPLFFPIGPEVLTGSTRLKAGTATKLVLNILTTASMVRLGKTVSNLMVDVRPTNEKLRARACRIVATLRGCDEVEARRRLVRARWNVKRACGD